MINKIVDEIHNEKYTMAHIESVTAIDFETIIIVNGDIDWTIEDIIKDNGYHIYESETYTIINDISYSRDDLNEKRFEFDKKFGYELGYQKMREWIHQPHKTVKEIKIEKDDFYLQKLYKKFQKQQKNANYLTVKDLIKRLEQTDQDAYVVIEDQEWGGYHSLYNDDDDDDDKPMEIITVRSCPDCNRGCCHKCKGREIFNKKLLSF